MHVIATAGHVDHGKSALVRALTGMEPDRWAEERRRGLTLDLGFAWTHLADVPVAFVDVPGHERFVPNMLAGLGPVPAVLFVVAADGGWMPQSAEHLAAIDALGVRHGLLAVTRSDLADPGPAMSDALRFIGASSLGTVEAVPVSSVTGTGLDPLRAALARLAASLPSPGRDAPVRLWVDRSFSIKGSGTVVTGTLPAGQVSVGQELLLTPSLRPVRVRALESLGAAAASVAAVARVALNLRGIPHDLPARGMALIEPDRWTLTSGIDVRVTPGTRLPSLLTLHIGSARTVARVRPLGADSGFARLTLRAALPLHIGDRVLLRDPGAAQPLILGATVLDVSPPPLSRRGSAALAARQLAAWPAVPGAADLLARHGLLRAGPLRAMGVSSLPAPVTGDWLADPSHWAWLQARFASMAAEHAERDPLAPALAPEAARAALRLPDRALADALARSGPAPVPGGPVLPPKLRAAVQAVRDELARAPFAAPDANRLAELGLDNKAIAVAAGSGLLLRVSGQIVLAPGADEEAVRILAALPQPFTTAQAREALGSTRRVVIPLLEHLDRARLTRRHPDDRREVLP